MAIVGREIALVLVAWPCGHVRVEARLRPHHQALTIVPLSRPVYLFPLRFELGRPKRFAKQEGTLMPTGTVHYVSHTRYQLYDTRTNYLMYNTFVLDGKLNRVSNRAA